jgi:hypothetical protein
MPRNNINGILQQGQRKDVWYPKENINTIMLQQNSSGNNDGANNNNDNDNDNDNDADADADTDGKPVGTNHLASLLYSSKEFTDVTFIVQGKEFKAHKAVLAVKCRTLLELVLNDNDDNDDNSEDEDDDDDDDSNDDNNNDNDSVSEDGDKKVKAITTTTTITTTRRGRNYNRKGSRSRSSQDDCYIELNDVKPKVFETLLEYVYGVHKNSNNNNNNNNSGNGNGVEEDEDDDQKIAAVVALAAINNDTNANANANNNNTNHNNEHNINENDEVYTKELLLAGNRFGCSHLKLYSESIIIDKYLCLDNASEYLPLADSHSCALLKEVAMDVISNNPKQAMESKNWFMIEESSRLLTELLLYYN